jgi:transcription elongation factor Elf1
MKKIYKQEYFNYHQSIFVVCPDCGKDAVVKNEYNYKQATLECGHCDLKKIGLDLVVYKAFVKLNCPICGHSIRYEQSNLKEKPKNITVKCDECESSFQVQARTEKYLNSLKKEEGLIHDAIFGCPYYFQTDFKGKLFWAKNREHLLEMENYISSDLRTRLSYGMRMVERLLTFIKEAKNREAILKILEKWKNSYK